MSERWVRSSIPASTLAGIRVAVGEAFDRDTGLLHARAWQEALEREVRLAETNVEQPPPSVTLVLVDIDDMRSYNDVNGHPVGDRLLVEIASVLQETCRPSDVVARIGGEEFGALLLGRSRPQTDALLSRLDAGLKAKRSCSFGVAHWFRGENYRDLIERADVALLLAKSRRRRRDE